MKIEQKEVLTLIDYRLNTIDEEIKELNNRQYSLLEATGSSFNAAAQELTMLQGERRALRNLKLDLLMIEED